MALVHEVGYDGLYVYVRPFRLPWTRMFVLKPFALKLSVASNLAAGTMTVDLTMVSALAWSERSESVEMMRMRFANIRFL